MEFNENSNAFESTQNRIFHNTIGKLNSRVQLIPQWIQRFLFERRSCFCVNLCYQTQHLLADFLILIYLSKSSNDLNSCQQCEILQNMTGYGDSLFFFFFLLGIGVIYILVCLHQFPGWNWRKWHLFANFPGIHFSCLKQFRSVRCYS